MGDKSSPEDIWKLLPGLSKAQYKAGVGALLRYVLTHVLLFLVFSSLMYLYNRIREELIDCVT